MDRVFYDGNCGLCHRSVRWLLAADADGTKFRFAPLDSNAFLQAVSAAARASIPDSIVIITEDGRLLTRSSGFIHVLGRIGGFWGHIGKLLALVPRPLRDAAYAGVARIRHKLFARPKDTCPLVPPDLRSRFLR